MLLADFRLKCGMVNFMVYWSVDGGILGDILMLSSVCNHQMQVFIPGATAIPFWHIWLIWIAVIFFMCHIHWSIFFSALIKLLVAGSNKGPCFILYAFCINDFMQYACQCLFQLKKKQYIEIQSHRWYKCLCLYGTCMYDRWWAVIGIHSLKHRLQHL